MTLGVEQEVTLVHCDSQSAMHLAKHQVYYARIQARIQARMKTLMFIVISLERLLNKVK